MTGSIVCLDPVSEGPWSCVSKPSPNRPNGKAELSQTDMKLRVNRLALHRAFNPKTLPNPLNSQLQRHIPPMPQSLTPRL